MFSRIILWSAAALVAGTLVVDSAHATTFLDMLASNTLASDTSYSTDVKIGGNGFAGGSGDNYYSFTYSFPPVLTATNSTTNLSVNGSGFTELTVSWILPNNTVAATVNALVALSNAVQNIDLPLGDAGTYQLLIHWALAPDTRGHYSTEILTPFVDNETPLPLPPALLLFGSALLGMSVLGRRRRQSAAG
jgi:hypothetical protein